MNTFEIVGILAAILLTWAYLPLVIRLIRQKSFQQLSNSNLALYILSATCWGVYGVRASSPSLVITSVIAFVSFSILLLLKINRK